MAAAAGGGKAASGGMEVGARAFWGRDERAGGPIGDGGAGEGIAAAPDPWRVGGVGSNSMWQKAFDTPRNPLSKQCQFAGAISRAGAVR
jgi:hypothetical protein